MHNSRIESAALWYIQNAQDVAHLQDKHLDVATLDYLAWTVQVRSTILQLFPKASFFWSSAPNGTHWPLMTEEKN